MMDVTSNMLDLWRGEWGPDAEKEYNKLGPTSQPHFQDYLRRFFRYAVRIDLIPKDPSLGLKPITKSEKRTQVLTSPQLQELLAAIPQYTKSQPGMVRSFGPEFRALFLLQRWSGLRIQDCLMLPRTALVGSNLRTKTKKTGAAVDCDLPDEVVGALQSLPVERDGFLPAEQVEKSVETQFKLVDQWNRRLFTALCRRYGLKPYRYPRQRHTTVVLRAPRSFINNTLWPEYLQIERVLRDYLNEATERIIREEVFGNSDEAEEQTG